MRVVQIRPERSCLAPERVTCSQDGPARCPRACPRSEEWSARLHWQRDLSREVGAHEALRGRAAVCLDRDSGRRGWGQTCSDHVAGARNLSDPIAAAAPTTGTSLGVLAPSVAGWEFSSSRADCTRALHVRGQDTGRRCALRSAGFRHTDQRRRYAPSVQTSISRLAGDRTLWLKEHGKTWTNIATNHS